MPPKQSPGHTREARSVSPQSVRSDTTPPNTPQPPAPEGDADEEALMRILTVYFHERKDSRACPRFVGPVHAFFRSVEPCCWELGVMEALARSDSSVDGVRQWARDALASTTHPIADVWRAEVERWFLPDAAAIPRALVDFCSETKRLALLSRLGYARGTASPASAVARGQQLLAHLDATHAELPRSVLECVSVGLALSTDAVGDAMRKAETDTGHAQEEALYETVLINSSNILTGLLPSQSVPPAAAEIRLYSVQSKDKDGEPNGFCVCRGGAIGHFLGLVCPDSSQKWAQADAFTRAVMLSTLYVKTELLDDGPAEYLRSVERTNLKARVGPDADDDVYKHVYGAELRISDDDDLAYLHRVAWEPVTTSLAKVVVGYLHTVPAERATHSTRRVAEPPLGLAGVPKSLMFLEDEYFRFTMNALFYGKHRDSPPTSPNPSRKRHRSDEN